ncbi:excisionase family DNA-binding protein [Streptomyces sp. NPDC002143]
MADRYLTVAQVAESLGTTERCPRRLVAERRIMSGKVGRHICIPGTALSAFIDSNTVQPIGDRRGSSRRVA